MQVTRRQFGMLLAIAPATASLAPGDAWPQDQVIERRVYERSGAVPPISVLRRCGMMLVRRDEAGANVELTISFSSLAERASAWDRFNSDPEWCALRDEREVRLRELAISASA